MFWIRLWNLLAFHYLVNVSLCSRLAIAWMMQQNFRVKTKQLGCFYRFMCICWKLEYLWQSMVKIVKTILVKVRGKEWIVLETSLSFCIFPYHPVTNTFWAVFESFFYVCLERGFLLKDDSWLQKGYQRKYSITIRYTMLDKVLVFVHLWDLSPTVCA